VSAALAAAALLPGARAWAQSPHPWGRVSFMADGVTTSDNGTRLPGFTELVGSFTFASPVLDSGGTEYKFDFRTAGYPLTAGRDTRVSLYDAYVGRSFDAGALEVRVGQMWLTDLGGLGSLGGGLVEYRLKKVGRFQRIRIGGFGGAEPKILDAGYVANVTKVGGYVAFDGQGAWRNVVGVVTIRDAGLTERTVLSTTNFLPIGKRVFIYQAAEADLTGPAGQGAAGLTYFFVNGRVSPSERIEIQGTFHRGRSIDARTITLDQLNGRPVSARALEGLLYESALGRVTVTLFKGFRVFVGYAQDRNNLEDAPTGRATFGFFSTNLFGTGLDVRLSDNRTDRPGSSYDAWDASVGRNLTPRVYLTFDYSSSLAVLRVTSIGGFQVEQRPRTTRYALTGLLNLNRWISLLLSGEHLRDGSLSQIRWLSGLTYRF
jgi:hypothetical protein